MQPNQEVTPPPCYDISMEVIDNTYHMIIDKQDYTLDKLPLYFPH